MWMNKPLSTPLFCAAKGTDALAVIVRALPWELAENYIIVIAAVVACVPLYGLWIEVRSMRRNA